MTIVLVCWRNRHRRQYLRKEHLDEQRSKRRPDQSLWRLTLPKLDVRRRYWICPGQVSSSSLRMSCPSLCFQSVTFQDFNVNNVDYPIYLDQVRRPQIARAPLTNVCSQCYDTAANVCAEYPSTLTISDVHCTYSTCAPCFAHSHLARHQRHRHVIRRGGRRRRRTRMLSRVLQHHRNRHQSDEFPRSGSILLSKHRQRDGTRLSVYDASCVDSKYKGELIVGRWFGI